VKNALKFSPGSEIIIKVAFDWPAEKLIMHVVDTGKGISSQEMNILFKMFSKVARTEQVNEEGIGMGLVICKRIIENSGG